MIDAVKSAEIHRLLLDYAGCLDDGRYAAWIDLFAPTASYELNTKENVNQNLPAALILCEDVGAILPSLRVISDAWLASKATREKRFSLGRFDERYLSHFPIALVRCVRRR